VPDAFRSIAARLADLNPSLTINDLEVLALIDRNENVSTLDGLCALTVRPREYVFAAVARLEDRGFLDKGAIR
jgi:hypothetical protein